MTDYLQKLVDDLSKLTVIEAADLAKKLEEHWGVSAATTMAMAMPAAGNTAVVEEKTEFDVILTSIGEKKIEVIKVVREVTGLGLKEAKDLVDSTPQAVKRGVSKEDSEKIKAKLEEAGAKIEVK